MWATAEEESEPPEQAGDVRTECQGEYLTRGAIRPIERETKCQRAANTANANGLRESSRRAVRQAGGRTGWWRDGLVAGEPLFLRAGRHSPAPPSAHLVARAKNVLRRSEGAMSASDSQRRVSSLGVHTVEP